MKNFKDYFTASKDFDLTNISNNVQFGKTNIQYQIMKYQDVVNLGGYPGYLLLMTQRIVIPSKSQYQTGISTTDSYENYPAILTNNVSVTAGSGATVKLRGIFPKTLNSSVNTAQSSSDGQSQSSSSEHTSGSTSNNINTFGVQISGGMFGPAPMFNIGADYSHTWDKGTSQSQSTGNAYDHQTSNVEETSMSIKDWSSFGYVDQTGLEPTWIWGQSYPWDVIQYNQTSDGTHVDLPKFIQDRLLTPAESGSIVLPPSQLSLFGLDFTMRAGWLIDFTDGISSDESVTVNHETHYFTASHAANGSSISASLQSSSTAARATYNSGSINLSAYALATVPNATSINGAAISFTDGQFIYGPSSPTSSFKILSAANNLQVTGSGFDESMTSDFSEPTALTVSFKIADITEEYSLLLKHWIGPNGNGCKLTFNINGKWTNIVYVDTKEGEGGQNNVSSLDLRNRDFTSLNFHDYLIVGTNQIVINIVPLDSSQSTSYTLLAIALGES
ncbi:hypothetical protein [Thalassospira marina]|uniref:Uncharacterized protein n=1 Tax=Thalassospira marina TaxID=2048283 RepID=A0A2N3KSR0_9PROT|nr:hypothetical protein [Thalassospira marina]PKR53575.1 hypothetical protein COO20_13635 [Thalassospira marina]